MGQIIKVYTIGDCGATWNGCAMWRRIGKALEFAWVPGGWDADRDLLEGKIRRWQYCV